MKRICTNQKLIEIPEQTIKSTCTQTYNKDLPCQGRNRGTQTCKSGVVVFNLLAIDANDTFHI